MPGFLDSVAVSLLASLGLGIACTPEPFVGRVSHSRYFEYHDREPEPLCPELLPALDEHATKIGPIVGFRPGTGDAIRYYKFRDLDELEAYGDCGSGAGACAVNGEAVLTPVALHLHELGHIYTQRGLSSPASALLEEGFAVALSCQPWLDVPSPLFSLPGFNDFRAFLNLRGDSAPSGVFSVWDYPAVGMFVTYLVRRYGWPRVQALYEAIPLGASSADFERAFAKTLPISADDAWRAALSAPDAPYCLSDWLCDAPSIVPGDADDTSCLDEVRRTFDVSAGQAGVVVSLIGSATALVDCGARSAPLWLPDSTQGMSDWIGLVPGRYALANLSGHPDRVRLAAAFSDGLVSEQCESAQEVTLSANEPTFIDLPTANNVALGFVRVSGHGQQFSLYTGLGIASPSISLCSGCGTDATCSQLFSTVEAPNVPLADGSVLRIENFWSRADWALAFYPESDVR